MKKLAPFLFTLLILTSCGTKKNVVTAESTSTSISKSSTPCPKADGTSERTTTFGSEPPTCIDSTKTYKATMVTDAGTIQIDLDAKKAPITVNNFVYLSRYHFYDGLTFHRAIEDFMIQGGDPKGDGTGGPGYEFKDELPASASQYKAGSLAMANSGPDTNGSQFFIVSSDSGGQKLTPNYSLFGSVTSGMDAVAQVIADGGSDSGNGTDLKKTHKITSVTITES